MSAYYLFDNQEVFDAEKLERYKREVAPIVARYGGRYVVLGGGVEVSEGTAPLKVPVMIEFPSVEQARRWYGSDEYRPLKELRLSALRSNAILMVGP